MYYAHFTDPISSSQSLGLKEKQQNNYDYYYDKIIVSELGSVQICKLVQAAVKHTMDAKDEWTVY